MRQNPLQLLVLAFAGATLVNCLPIDCCSASAASDPKRAAEIRKRSGEWIVITRDAEALTKSGKYKAAIEKYSLILEQRKKLGLDLMVQQIALADMYEKTGELDKTDAYHRESIQGREAQGGDDDPTLSFPLEAYAAYLKRVGKTEEAAKMTARLAYIEKQRTAPPKELVALGAQKDLKDSELSIKAVEIGDTYLNRDQERRALMAYEKAILWNPANAVAYAARGETYRRLEEDAKAKKDLDKAIELDNQNARALFQRALYLEGLKKYSLALVDFDKAIKANPLDSETIGLRAKLYQNTSRFDQAIADYSRVLELDPNATWALMQRGLCFEEKKQFDRAERDYLQLASIVPDNSDYKEALARVKKKLAH